MANNPLISKQMSIVFDGSILGCTSDFSFNIDRDLIEIACLDSAAKKQVPDLYSWSVSFSGFVVEQATATSNTKTYYDLVNNIVSSDSSVGVYILPDVSAQTYYTGAGYLKNVTMDGGVGSAVTFSGEITGSGLLSSATTV